MTTPNITKAAVGQIWAERARLYERRTIRVDRVEGRFVYGTTLTDTQGNPAAPRKTRIQLDEKEQVRGYRLIADSVPIMWEVPAEPGPEITAVTDRDGQIWTRDEDEYWTRGDAGGFMWPILLIEQGPLTNATSAPRPEA